MKIHHLLAVLLLSSPLLAQIDTGGGGGAGAVASVFGRTGAVVAASGDYTLDLLGDPGANKSFTMSTRTLNFNFTGNWGAGFGYSITSNGSNAATGPLFQLSSGSGTTHDVFQACALGTSNCAKFTSTGSFTTIGTATIDATKLLGNLPALNGSALTNLPAGTPSYPVTVAGTVTSGGIPYFSATTTQTSSALLTSNSPVLGGGAGAAPKTATFLTTNGTAELDIGVAAGGNGVLGLKGNTSGTATITAPAAAGTPANPILISNAIQNIQGTAASPSYAMAGGYGMYRGGGSPFGVVFAYGGTAEFQVGNTNIAINSGLPIGWGTGDADSGGVLDTGISRSAANVTAVGNGSAANTTGKLKLAGVISVGTKFTASGCSNGTTVGGATAGRFTSGTTGACTVTITMGDTATAPNGWACYASDQTTPANLISETTGGSTTTAVITGTTVTGDIVTFGCMGY